MWATSTLGSAICCVLIDQGFEVSGDVGAPVVATRGELTFEPLVELSRYFRGEMTLEDWRARWTDLGLADHRFARA